MNIIALKATFAGIISCLITFYMVPLLCTLAHKFRVLDVPGGIKKHAQPTPYLGGVAVYCGMLSSLALTYPFENKTFLLLVGSTLLLFLGLIDDLITLKPAKKFFGQFLVTLCFLKAGLYLKEHAFYTIWAFPVSALWIVTIINAFNLVDVMDGLATTLALCATASFLLIAIMLEQYTVVLLLSSFLGALLGFLWHNRPPACIYLGDAGALFIGGFLATVPFLFNWGTYNRYGFFAAPIILAMPLLEVSTLILVRSYKGIPFYYGSPDHFCLYLQQNGWHKSTILYYCTSMATLLLTGGYALCFNHIGIATATVLGIIFLSIWVIVIKLK